MQKSFFLRKMRHSGSGLLEYWLGEVKISDFVEKEIKLAFSGNIQCVHCARAIKKTFGQGFCYPCFMRLAECDSCILKPELCHFRKGTCREPEWAQKQCLIPHIVYLSNTSGLKVGITREHKKFERWGDQGATEALIVARVPERYYAGLIEVQLKAHIKDKTDWRALLRGEKEVTDIRKDSLRLAEAVAPDFKQYLVPELEQSEIFNFEYPVRKYPEKVSSYQIEKDPNIVGELEGIIGQYLIISGKVINIRKYSGYEVSLAC